MPVLKQHIYITSIDRPSTHLPDAVAISIVKVGILLAVTQALIHIWTNDFHFKQVLWLTMDHKIIVMGLNSVVQSEVTK